MKTKYLLGLGLLLAFISSVSAQSYLEVGHLPIQNFSASEYGAFRQNWGIAEDGRGLIYVANKWGILEYDGSDWKTLEGFPDDAEPFDLVIDAEGHLWVGAQDEIGYFLPDSSGALRYHSMADSLLKKTESIGQFKKANRLGDTLYFQTTDKIVTYTSSRGFKVYSNGDTVLQQVVVDGRYLIQIKNKGLFKLSGDNWIPVSEAEEFKTQRLVSIVKHSANTNWAIMQNGKVYAFDWLQLHDKGLKLVNTSLGNFKHGDVLDAISAGKGRIAISIRAQGVLLLNREGEIVQIVNKNSGLKDKTVNRLFADSRHLLWMATMDGIAVAVENSPLSSKSEEDNLEGTVESITRFRNRLYVASQVGLYALGSKNKLLSALEDLKPPFSKIQNFEKACYVLFNYQEESLLIAANDGLYELNDKEQLRKVYSDHEVIYAIESSPEYPGVVFLGVQGGLVALQKINNTWIRSGLLEMEHQVLSVKFAKDILWFSVIGEALVGTTRYEKGDFETPTFYNETQGVPQSDNIPFIYNQEVYLATAFGLRLFNANDKKFEISNKLGVRFADSLVNIIRISEDQKGKVWIFCAKEGEGESFGYVSKNPNGTMDWNENYFRSVARENILAISHDPNDVTWFGGGGGLHRFDFKQIEEVSLLHPVLVRKSMFGNKIFFNGTFYDADGRIQVKQTERFKPQLKYENNSFQIKFSSIHSELGTSLEYSVMLEGVDEDWSPPGKINVVNYSNLNAGNYLFKVKSIDEYGIESEVSEFKFTILPPWYETIGFYLAQTTFLLALILVSYLTNRNPKVSRLSSILTLITIITIFEILVTLVEPLLDNYSGGVPVFKLSMNVVLALSLNPLEGLARRVLSPKSD